MRLFVILTIALAGTLAPIHARADENPEVPVTRAADGWGIYSNPRFGFVLPVPPGMKAQRPPENGDGQAFASADGKVTLTGWGSFNVDHTGDVEPRWQAALAEPGRKITYQRKTATWFVVSGVGDDGVAFYEKYTADKNNCSGWTITYPQADEKKFAPWVERIAAGYQPRLGKGHDSLTKTTQPTPADQTGAEATKKPVSAGIVPVKGRNTEPPAGNVEVKYADGTTDRWTTKGIAAEPKVAADGTVGWYVCATDAKGKLELEAGDTPVPVALVVCKAGKIQATINDLTNPRGWGFDADGAHVVVYEGAKHGPGWVRRFEIKGGKETAQFSFSEIEDPAKCQPWARPFFEP